MISPSFHRQFYKLHPYFYITDTRIMVCNYQQGPVKGCTSFNSFPLNFELNEPR